VLEKVRLDKAEPASARPRARPGTAGAAGAAGETRRPVFERAPPRDSGPSRRAERPQPARRKLVEELMEKTEQMIRLARQADVYRHHTAFLMELEAELHAIARRLGDASGELGGVHHRLKEMVAQLRGLDFKRTQPEAPPPAAEEPNHYELLQLTPAATLEEIRTAYHRLLKQYHPDLHNSSRFDWVKSEAERMSRRISEAYDVLSNQGAREKYDRELRQRRRPAP
jgi:hypothetical protein